MAEDWYGLIEPRRAAEVALTPAGLSGPSDADPLNSPPADGQEESWLSQQLQRLRDLTKTASGYLATGKRAVKKRVEKALGDIRAAARKGKDLAASAVPDREDLKDGFESLGKLASRLLATFGMTQIILLVVAYYVLKELGRSGALRFSF